MTQQNKFLLPYVLDGIITKLSALFLKKLVLFDFEKLQAKHLRHYDHECEGIIILVDFLQRKMSKSAVFAFQMIKDPNLNYSEDEQFTQVEKLKDKISKTNINNLDETSTPITKFLSRVNTTVQESDNSLFYSPSGSKNRKLTSRTSYPDSICQKSDILNKLLNRVKSINMEASQQIIISKKSPNFSMNLGRQSFHTFRKQCHCECHNQSCSKESKIMKRKRILQRFEQIEQQIYEQAPPVYSATYLTPRPVTQIQQYQRPRTSYSVYYPPVYESRPRERKIVYINQAEQPDPFYDTRSYSGISTSRSVTHISYAHQVYI